MGRTLRNCSTAGKVAVWRYYSPDKEPVSGRREEFQWRPTAFSYGLRTSLETARLSFNLMLRAPIGGASRARRGTPPEEKLAPKSEDLAGAGH